MSRVIPLACNRFLLVIAKIRGVSAKERSQAG